MSKQRDGSVVAAYPCSVDFTTDRDGEAVRCYLTVKDNATRSLIRAELTSANALHLARVMYGAAVVEQVGYRLEGEDVEEEVEGA